MTRVLDIVYLVIVVVVTQILSLPQILLGFLSLPLLIIIPYRVGLAVTFMLEKLHIGFHYSSKLFDVFLQWCLGVLILFFVTATLSYFSLFDVRWLIVFVFVMVSISIPSFSSLTKCYSRSDLDPLVYLVLVNGFMVMLILRFYSFPPPFQPGWDIFAEMSMCNKICYNNFFSVNTVDYSATFRFDFKSPVFPLIEGVVSLLLGVDFLTLCWTLPFMMVPLFGVFIYTMTMKMTGNKVASSLAGTFAVWTGDFSRPSQILPQQTAIAVVMIPLVIAIVWQEYKKQEMNTFPKLIVIFATIILFHYILGFLLLILLLVSLIFLERSNKRPINSLAVIISITSALFAMLIFQGIINIPTIEWDPLFILTGYKGYNIKPSESYTRILEGLTPFLLTLTLITLVQQNLRGWLSKTSNKKGIRWAVWVFSGLLLLYALPIANTHRIFPLIQILAALLAAITIETVIKSVKPGWTSTIATVLIVILMIPFLSTPILSFIQRAQSKTDIPGNISSFSDYELAMANWLKENTEENTLLISDPTTQLISEALSRRPSLTGMYMDSETANLLKQAIISPSDFISYALIREIIPPNNNQQILLISGRTIEWAKRKTNEPIYYPLKMKEQYYAYLNKFNQSYFFTILNEIQNQIYAIKIHNVTFEKPDDFIIFSGNETSGWDNPGIYQLTIDKTDFITGNSSIVLSGKNMTPGWHPFWYNIESPIDLTKYNILTICLKVTASYTLDNPNAFAIIIIDADENRNWWRNNISFTLTPGEWQEIKLNILTPDMVEGKLNLAKIAAIRFTNYYEEIGNLTVYIDSITAMFSLEPFLTNGG